MPIENTLAGSVHENYDHLVNFELPIVAETNVRIVHNLIALKGVPFSGIKRVFSHPVALNQCRDFFARNPQSMIIFAVSLKLFGTLAAPCIQFFHSRISHQPNGSG